LTFIVVSASTFGFGIGCGAFTGQDFAFENPHLDANNPKHRHGFRKTIINICTERVQGDTTFFGPFSTGNFGTAQTASNHHLDTFGTSAHRTLNRLFHGPTESSPLFKLLGNGISNELRFHIHSGDFNDVQLDILAVGQFLEILSQGIQSLTSPAYHNAWTASDNPDNQLLSLAVDFNPAHRC
jgi:hypothetical protein